MQLSFSFCLYICAFFNFALNELLKDSSTLNDVHLSFYLNNLIFQNSPNVSNQSTISTYNRKIRSYFNINDNLETIGVKQSFPQNFAEIPLAKVKSYIENTTAILPEKSEVLESNAKLEVPLFVENSFSPTADINRLKSNLQHLFSYARNSVSNISAKADIQHHIINIFKFNHLITSKHKFITTGLSSDFPILEGLNIIGIRPGKYRSSHNDHILLIGAHYDTVANTSGVNDNGSGMSALLEIIRLINIHNCQLSYTLMFVAFDLEEYGGIGSKYFVNDYLIPYELKSRKSNFEGAFILDTILNFNQTLGSQDIPYDVFQAIPKWGQQIKSNGFIGDFLAIIYRNNIDSKLAYHIRNSWNYLSKQTPYRLNDLSISSLGSQIPNYNVLAKHANLLRSDHIMFWYHNSSIYNNTLNAVLITDTGPFRGYMRYCYHKSCDNKTQINDENLKFLKLTVEALTRAVVDISSGQCFEHPFVYNKSSQTDDNWIIECNLTIV